MLIAVMLIKKMSVFRSTFLVDTICFDDTITFSHMYVQSCAQIMRKTINFTGK